MFVRRLFHKIESLFKTIWSHPAMSWLLIVGTWGCCVWFWFWPQLPGVAVTVLGSAAAIMTFRNMHATHKMLATIAIFVLMGIELNDIRKDRAKTDAQQGADRKEASENFTAIATGIKTAISNSSEQFHETVAGLKSTLNATRQTIENTRPRAILEFADMSPVPQYLPIATNHSIVFNVTFINAGNEEAKQLDHLARIYVGKLDDAETQRLMLLDFTKRWKEGQRTNNPFIKTK